LSKTFSNPTISAHTIILSFQKSNVLYITISFRENLIKKINNNLIMRYYENCSIAEEELTNSFLSFLQDGYADQVEPTALDLEPIPIAQATNQQSKNYNSQLKRSPKVNHSYTDYATFSREDASRMSSNSYMSNSGKKKLFPSKLMDILTTDGNESAICWCPHGRAFKVINAKRFEQTVLPRYFKTSLMRSFRKQLSLWGFRRITKGVDAGSYYHECFLRGIPHLLSMIKYSQVKGFGKASIPNPKDEPNFYLYPTLESDADVSSSFVEPIVTFQPLHYCSNNICNQSSGEKKPLNKSSINNIKDINEESNISQEEYIEVVQEMSFPMPFMPPPYIIY